MGAAQAPLLYVAALVAYDGTDYGGFQVQPGVPTIQGALEKALGTFTSIEGRIAGAGRTDAGVHARGQVVAVRVKWRHDLAALQRAWNAHLPSAVAVRAVQFAPPAFHPRFSAAARTYRYAVVQAGSAQRHGLRRSPLTDRFAAYEQGALDLAAMQDAAAALVGTHDFGAFGRPPQGENSVRTVMQAGWAVLESSLPALEAQPDRLLIFSVTADAFLQRMVRSLVGTLLDVGRGRLDAAAVREILTSRERGRSSPPAPSAGLVLERVTYPLDAGVQFE